MEFVGHINGITKRNKTNVTYQSMIDGELVYEYQIHHMYKKTASFRCAGCRSAISDGRAPDFKPEYLSGKVDFVAKTVRFKRDPDEEPHCCERRHPHWVKGKQLRFNVRNDKKETGATGTECIQALNKEVKDKEEDGDHDGVMFHIGNTIVAVFCDYPNWQKSFVAGVIFVKDKDTAAYDVIFKKLKFSKKSFHPRFVLQDAAAVPNPQPVQQPIIQQQIPQPQQLANQPNAFIHSFFGQQQLDFAGMRQMIHQPIRPEFYQNQFYQRFAPPPIRQQPPPQRVNLNQSLPVYYNHQYLQQFPPQFYRF